jgi:hypothetical protein
LTHVRNRRWLAAAIALVLSSVLSVAHAKPRSARGVEPLARELSSAFAAKALGRLDARPTRPSTVTIVVQHSITGRAETKRFRTFRKGEQWLRSREREGGGPARVSSPLLRCRHGICTYDDSRGLLHNTLYLTRAAYGYRKGLPYIKTIYLLDGD